jgi:pilus assembly protein CpaC
LIAALIIAAALAAPTAAVAATQVIPTNGSSVSLEVNKGTVVRLSRPAATVFVSDPAICDIQMKSPKLIYLMGKRPGQTSLYAVDEAENVLANVDVSVSHNISRLQSSLRALHPDADIQITTVDSALVIDGVVSDPSVSEDVRRLAARLVGAEGEIINRLGISAPTQVNLRVRVAEVSRDVEKALGLNWEIMLNRYGTNLALSVVNPLAATGTLPAQVFGSTNALNNNLSVQNLLDLLEDQGLVTMLAEPNLTALTGETASFLAGGEFPIPVPDDDKVVIEFKKFGVSLSFTPTILNDNRINLHVRPEVSELSLEGAIQLPIGVNQALVVPGLTTRRAETTVELASGQSFAIAGLLSNNTTHDVHKVPGLSDVPVLGRLFTSDRFKRDESELVIIVTPYVVRPTPGRLAQPNDGYVAPTDGQRLHPGGTWQESPVAGPPSTVAPDGTRLPGPIGFAFD